MSSAYLPPLLDHMRQALSHGTPGGSERLLRELELMSRVASTLEDMAPQSGPVDDLRQFRSITTTSGAECPCCRRKF